MVEKAQIKSVFINSPIFDDVDPNPFDFNTEGCQEVAPIDLQECKISGGLLRIENQKEDMAEGQEGQGETNFQEAFYCLVGQYIVMYQNEEDSVQRGRLNIKYARLKKHYFKDTTGKYMYGFILMCKGKTHDFYMEDLKKREEWVSFLKRHVICLDLKEEYVIGKLLGRGNFAKVHVCHLRADMTQQFAMKTMQKSALKKSRRNIQSILTEIDVLRSIDHPNVIIMYECFETSKYIHLVLPFLEGGELFEKIKSKGLYKESHAIPVMRNFLSALSYLHERNIVHRDLKPENLILASKNNDWDLRIADFGLASIMDSQDQKLSLRCGSPGYVAPELLQDKGYNCQADVFSVGVIFYIMLTGRLLFNGNDQNAILEKNMKCDYQFNERQWEHISKEARDLVVKLLKEDPNERITAAEALRHPWFEANFTDGQGIVGQQLAQIQNERKKQALQKNPLVTCTPVMAGTKLKDLPPETPFLQSDGQQLVNRTPIMRRFNMPGAAARAGAAGGAPEERKQVNIMGITFNRPNFAGATANAKQQNQMQSTINAIKGANPNKFGPDGKPLLQQIPAFNKLKAQNGLDKIEENEEGKADARQGGMPISAAQRIQSQQESIQEEDDDDQEARDSDEKKLQNPVVRADHENSGQVAGGGKNSNRESNGKSFKMRLPYIKPLISASQQDVNEDSKARKSQIADEALLREIEQPLNLKEQGMPDKHSKSKNRKRNPEDSPHMQKAADNSSKDVGSNRNNGLDKNEQARIQAEFREEQKQQELQRSVRFMDFNERDFNEYVSSDDEEMKQAQGDPGQPRVIRNGDRAASDGEFRKREMMIQPFKPGKAHNGLRQIPQSVQEIKYSDPLFKKNQRKLPPHIMDQQQQQELQMREMRGKEKRGAANKEQQEREAQIRALLSNIPVMSKETLQANRKRIAQAHNDPTEKREEDARQRKHKQLLENLKNSVEASAKKIADESPLKQIKSSSKGLNMRAFEGDK